jgi:hypothetical protein
MPSFFQLMQSCKVIFNHQKIPHVPPKECWGLSLAGECPAGANHFYFLIIFIFIKNIIFFLSKLIIIKKTMMKIQKIP